MTLLDRAVKPNADDSVRIIEGAFEITPDEIIKLGRSAGQFLGSAFEDRVKTLLVETLHAANALSYNYEVVGCVLACEPFTVFTKWTYSLVCVTRF